MYTLSSLYFLLVWSVTLSIVNIFCSYSPYLNFFLFSCFFFFNLIYFSFLFLYLHLLPFLRFRSCLLFLPLSSFFYSFFLPVSSTTSSIFSLLFKISFLYLSQYSCRPLFLSSSILVLHCSVLSLPLIFLSLTSSLSFPHFFLFSLTNLSMSLCLTFLFFLLLGWTSLAWCKTARDRGRHKWSTSQEYDERHEKKWF